MNEKSLKTAVFIDGSNLYFKLRDKSLGIKSLTNFKYGEFVKYLVENNTLVDITYFVGAIRAKQNDKIGQKLRSEQQKLFSNLTNSGIKLELGYLMKNDGTFHEKGVDVKMAVDIVVGAFKNKYDKAIIISSDTDLIPAIKEARKLGKHIEYIGFSNKPSFGLIKETDSARLLIKADIEKFKYYIY